LSSKLSGKRPNAAGGAGTGASEVEAGGAVVETPVDRGAKMAAKISARGMKRHIDFAEFLYVWGYISFLSVETSYIGKRLDSR